MLLGLLGGNVCCCMCYVAKGVFWSFIWESEFGFLRGKVTVGSFRWQCVLLGLLGGSVWCCRFCRQSELSGLLRGNVRCCMFEVAMCVYLCFRWQA